MNVLVIGGNRFFGKRLVHLLNTAGHNVTVANRGSRPDLFLPPIKTVKVDRTDAAAMEKVFGGTTWDLVYDQVCNTGIEADIVRSVFKKNIDRLIFTSTASVYTTAPDRAESFFDPRTFSENDASEHDYQHSKRLAEKSYLDAEFPVVAMRIPVVVGSDDYKMRMHWHIERIMKQEPIYFPDLNAKYSFIRSEDAAKFLFWLLSNDGGSGAINACSPDPVCLADFIKSIEDNCGKKAVFADEATDSNHSPYGTASDSFLSVQKAQNLGFQFPMASDWFPELVSDLCKDYNNWLGRQI